MMLQVIKLSHQLRPASSPTLVKGFTRLNEGFCCVIELVAQVHKASHIRRSILWHSQSSWPVRYGYTRNLAYKLADTKH